jgi:hypothetical protein
MIYDIFNCNWVGTRWKYNSTHLHTNNTPNTKNGTYITIKELIIIIINYTDCITCGVSRNFRKKY